MLEIQLDKQNGSRRFCIGNVPSLDDVPSTLESIATSYALFLALDATSVRNEVLQKAAKTLLDRGMVYLCAWGPDCERVHDQFDLLRDPKEPEGQVVMTTWHSNESLPEALWFFANCAWPDEAFKANCTDWVAFSVANEAWAQEIRMNLIEGRVAEPDAPPEARAGD